METDLNKRQIHSIVKWIRSTWDKLMRCSIQILDLVIFVEFHSVSNSRLVLRKWGRELCVELMFFFIGSPADMPTRRRMEFDIHDGRKKGFISMEEDLELERQLKIFNRPPIRSFKGTVHIRRTTKEDLVRAKSLSRLIPSTANSFVPNSKGHHESESSFDFPSYSDADSRLVTHAISQNMKSPMQFSQHLFS
ncbi:hypothetical protein SADUNF_Sadunf15G0117200 [Salix dunnii]|uniref:Uncharacterized protein n=1 Tax=Salix dunnii TaxID=1413687 RepID=A0A835JBV3_9ROSI|nr:hypothetical protein SADUNF_Sadunf15G0117200 [Salix dunnii]